MNKIASSADIAENVTLGENIKIGENVVIKSGCIIGDNVVLEDGVFVDYNVIVRNYVTIKAGGNIGVGCILGEYLADFYTNRESKNYPLTIGQKSIIRSQTVIYANSIIGDNFQTGHHVTIRENSEIGNHVRIGTYSDIQGDCTIQDYVNIHSNVFIAQKSVIKKYAWLFPHVVLTNDPNPPSETELGIIVEEFAAVAARAVVLPGVVIGEGSLAGAGAVVTKDVEAGKVVVGNPAKVLCDTKQIRDNVTRTKVYPWKYTFDRGMPWQGIGYDKWVEKERGED